MIKDKNLKFSAIYFVIFAVFTLMVKFIDVQPIGPEGSMVGFSKINAFFENAIGVHMFWYNLTNVFGVLALAIALGFGILGLIQLIKRKSFFKVDVDILILGAFYILIIAVYLFFEVVIVNYRPIIIDGELAASYPSSHTMIVICIMQTAIVQLEKRLRDKSVRRGIQVAFLLIIILTVIGRLVSGVHWFTDILGGVILSLSLVNLYVGVVNTILRNKQ